MSTKQNKNPKPDSCILRDSLHLWNISWLPFKLIFCGMTQVISSFSSSPPWIWLRITCPSIPVSDNAIFVERTLSLISFGNVLKAIRRWGELFTNILNSLNSLQWIVEASQSNSEQRKGHKPPLCRGCLILLLGVMHSNARLIKKETKYTPKLKKKKKKFPDVMTNS